MTIANLLELNYKIQSGNENAHKMNADSATLSKLAEKMVQLWLNQLDWFQHLFTVEASWGYGLD